MTPNPNPSPEGVDFIESNARRVAFATRTVLTTKHLADFAAGLPVDGATEATLPPPTPAETVTVALPGAGEVETLRKALGWYEQMVGDCRKITSVGEAARACLDKDGGKLATQALATVAAANDEGVARIIDPYAWRCYDATLRPFQENRGAHEGESWHVRAYQAGCRSADDARLWWRETANDVEPYTVQRFRDSLAKAAAIRLLSQGGGK